MKTIQFQHHQVKPGVYDMILLILITYVAYFTGYVHTGTNILITFLLYNYIKVKWH